MVYLLNYNYIPKIWSKKLADEKEEIVCLECGWYIPDELFAKLLDQDHIYCEKCGAEIYKKDYNIQVSQYKSKQTQKALVESLLTIAKKKSAEYKQKLKLKWQDFKEKHEKQG